MEEGSMKKPVVFLALVGALSSLFAAEPPTTPRLQLELGMQLQSEAIATDSAGRFVLTCGADGTGRLWDVRSTQLLHVYRVPLGKDQEGTLLGCALSPDGSTIALSGRTGYTWDGRISIYVFDRTSGEMTHRLSGLPNYVHNLAFSPDGSWLVAGLNGKDGIRVWRTDTWILSGGDSTNYNGIYTIAFGKRDSRQLLAVSNGNKILLYDVGSQLNLLSSIDHKRGVRNFSFSSDGRFLAVASIISPEVIVYSVGDNDLQQAYEASVANSGQDPITQVAGGYTVQFSKTNGNLYGLFSF